MSDICPRPKNMEEKKLYPNYGSQFLCFLFIEQPSSMFAIGNFENIISIYY